MGRRMDQDGVEERSEGRERRDRSGIRISKMRNLPSVVLPLAQSYPT